MFISSNAILLPIAQGYPSGSDGPGPNGQGPNLHGLIGREAGKARGFAYSAGFRKALAGKVWTRELLDAWLTDTQQVAPDTLMTYFMDDAALRAEIVDFMVGTAAK